MTLRLILISLAKFLTDLTILLAVKANKEDRDFLAHGNGSAASIGDHIIAKQIPTQTKTRWQPTSEPAG